MTSEGSMMTSKLRAGLRVGQPPTERFAIKQHLAWRPGRWRGVPAGVAQTDDADRKGMRDTRIQCDQAIHLPNRRRSTFADCLR
jgi:hypothetical protein